MSKTLRPYQQECVDKVFEEKEKGCRAQLITMSTGLGKTIIGTTIAQRFQRTLWAAHREELVEQAAMTVCSNILDVGELSNLNETNGLIEFFRENKKTGLFESDLIRKVKNTVGIVKADLFQIDSPFTVASAQTLYKRLDRIPVNHFNHGVVDEAHLFVSKTFIQPFRYFNFDLLCGYTATAERLDGVSLTDLFDKITFQRDTKFGIDNGYLCELEGIRVKTEVSLDKVRTTAGDLNTGDLKNAVDDPVRNKLIVQKWIEYAAGRKTLVFAVDVEHAQNLCKAFKDAGISATFVVADKNICPDRRERIEDFRDGVHEVLINVEIMTTGVDIPDISCIVWARPTESKTLYIQGTGRGGRLKSEACRFKNCLIIDIVDNTSKHELVNTWTLEKDKKIEDKVYISKEKQLVLIAKEKERRESMMKEISHDQRVVLIPLPKVAVWDTMRNREDATEKQLAVLQKEGHNITDNHWTKGQATEVISKLKATHHQVEELRKMGYDVKNGATIGEYRLAMERGTREIGFGKAARARGISLPLYNVQ